MTSFKSWREEEASDEKRDDGHDPGGGPGSGPTRRAAGPAQLHHSGDHADSFYGVVRGLRAVPGRKFAVPQLHQLQRHQPAAPCGHRQLRGPAERSTVLQGAGQHRPVCGVSGGAQHGAGPDSGGRLRRAEPVGPDHAGGVFSALGGGRYRHPGSLEVDS